MELIRERMWSKRESERVLFGHALGAAMRAGFHWVSAIQPRRSIALTAETPMQNTETTSPRMAGVKPKQTKRRAASMALILDHAEAEFAKRGYSGTTLVSVAAVAGVDTALMRYYFGDKEQLFAAVFRRRGKLVNDARRQELASYRDAAGSGATLEGLIDAFIRSGFEMGARDEGWMNFAAIVAYVNMRENLHPLMSEVFDDVSRELIEAMQRIMPAAHRDDLYWGYHFLTGTFTFSLGQTGRIDRISDGRVSSRDFPGIAHRLPQFVAAGIRALVAQRAAKDVSSDGSEELLRERS